MHILNFFAPNFGSPCRTQSSIISYQLNFHQKQLVELFVQGVLGNLVHQNKILSFDIDSATLITEPSLFSLSLGFSRWNTQQFSVLSCGFRAVRDVIEVRIVNSDLVELFGLKTCVETGLDQTAKLLGAGAELRMSCAFGTGKFGQDVVRNMMSK